MPKTIKTTAESTAGAVFGLTIALCAAAVLIMGTVKIGLIWFG